MFQSRSIEVMMNSIDQTKKKVIKFIRIQPLGCCFKIHLPSSYCFAVRNPFVATNCSFHSCQKHSVKILWIIIVTEVESHQKDCPFKDDLPLIACCFTYRTYLDCPYLPFSHPFGSLTWVGMVVFVKVESIQILPSSDFGFTAKNLLGPQHPRLNIYHWVNEHQNYTFGTNSKC